MKFIFILFIIYVNSYATSVLGTGSIYADMLGALNTHHQTTIAPEKGLLTQTEVLGKKFMAGQEMMNKFNEQIQEFMGNGYVQDTQSILEECFAVEMPDIGLDLNLDFGFCGAEALGRLLDRAAADFSKKVKEKPIDKTEKMKQCKEYNTFYSPETNNIKKVCIKYYKDDEKIKGKDNEPLNTLTKGQMKDLITASSKTIPEKTVDIINNLNIQDDIVKNKQKKENDIIVKVNKLNNIENDFNQKYNVLFSNKVKKTDTFNYLNGNTLGSVHLVPIYNKDKIKYNTYSANRKDEIRVEVATSLNNYLEDNEKDEKENLDNFLTSYGYSTPFTNALLLDKYANVVIANNIFGQNKASINEDENEDQEKEDSSQGDEGYQKANIMANFNLANQILLINQQLENQNRLRFKNEIEEIKLLTNLLIELKSQIKDLKIQNKAYLNPNGKRNIKSNEIVIENDKVESILKTKNNVEANNCEYIWNGEICLCPIEWKEKIDKNANCKIQNNFTIVSPSSKITSQL